MIIKRNVIASGKSIHDVCGTVCARFGWVNSFDRSVDRSAISPHVKSNKQQSTCSYKLSRIIHTRYQEVYNESGEFSFLVTSSLSN